MEGAYSTVRLKSFLLLPINYFVLERRDEIPTARVAFAKADFLVCDVRDVSGVLP